MEEKAELETAFKSTLDRLHNLENTHSNLLADHEDTLAQMKFLQQEKDLASQDARRFQEGHKIQEATNAQLIAKNDENEGKIEMLTKQLGRKSASLLI